MFRIDPSLPVSAYDTYSIDQPADTTVKAACHDVGCPAYLRGWETPVDESTELGRQQAAYIRGRSGRTFTEVAGAGVTVFRFEARQRCFADHKTRPQTFAVRRGDWRADLGPLRTHSRPIDWVEDMQEALSSVSDDRKRG
jgi:hypothetical protein